MTTSWQPGDDPQDHPAWRDQVNLEMHMLRSGADAAMAQLAKAREKGQMTRMRPYRRLLDMLMPAMVRGVKQWLDDCRRHHKATGIRPASFDYIARMDPYLCAYTTLHSVLDVLVRDSAPLLTVAMEIGIALEHEARIARWEQEDPRLFYGVQRALRRNRATPVHRRRVNINRFNKLVAEKIEWEPWPAGDRRRIGIDLVDILCRFSGGHFSVYMENGLDAAARSRSAGGGAKYYKTRRGSKVAQRRLVVTASEKVMDFLMKSLERLELASPIYLPTLMPPKRWTGVRGGGYYTEYVYTRPLIRFKAHQEEQARAALDDYDALDMPTAYASVNAVQEVPWYIDGRVLRVAKHVWEKDLAIAGFPTQKPEPLPPKPDAQREERAVWKDWKRKAYVVWCRRAQRLADVRLVSRTLAIAERYRSRTFYFPHMYDFRGRMYPIPAYLQPQGTDLARGLLRFREARPIYKADGSWRWLAIQLANAFGLDKESYEDRVRFVEENEALWRRIDKSPLRNLEWAEADSPWQALQAIFEWCRWLDAGDGFLSSLPCRVDGTCNGIQHLSALTRDGVGGASVNLTPSGKPRDIYAEVASPLTERLKRIAKAGGEEGEHAQWWLDIVGDAGVPRGLTKRPVMILPYGGTRHAYGQYIYEWLEENHRDLVEEADVDDIRLIWRRVAWLSGHLWAIVKETASGGVGVMEWLKRCARSVAEVGQPVYWVTPAGFVVRHFYGKTRERRVRLRVDGQTYTCTDYEATKDIDLTRQLRGIAPNYVHSLDAAALMVFIVAALRENITSISTIHDNVGALAADMGRVQELVREAFVRVHEEDLLGELRSSFKVLLMTHLIAVNHRPPDLAEEEARGALPEPVERGDLDLMAVLESDYFFS